MARVLAAKRVRTRDLGGDAGDEDHGRGGGEGPP
jgi:hypothetical protein